MVQKLHKIREKHEKLPDLESGTGRIGGGDVTFYWKK